MVSYIRVMNKAWPKVLIGSSRGYYITSSMKDIEDQIESLEGRVNQMNAAIDAIKAQRENLKHLHI